MYEELEGMVMGVEGGFGKVVKYYFAGINTFETPPNAVSFFFK
jgi:hypothetical protein